MFPETASTNYSAATAAPKQRPELRERAHSFLAAVEHLDMVHARLTSMRDRLSGPVPQAVEALNGRGGATIEQPLTVMYSSAADDIENRISRIRQTIEEIERII